MRGRIASSAATGHELAAFDETAALATGSASRSAPREPHLRPETSTIIVSAAFEGRPIYQSDRRDLRLVRSRLETTLVTMTTASITDLKANLSRYLHVVRRGGEVQVLDRGTPVARLVPPTANDDEGIRERLIAKGMLRPGKGSAAAILDKPPLALPVNLSEALAEDRTDRL